MPSKCTLLGKRMDVDDGWSGAVETRGEDGRKGGSECKKVGLYAVRPASCIVIAEPCQLLSPRP